MCNPIAAFYKWFVFKAGDTRWLGWKFFPFIATWDVRKPDIKGSEVLTALRHVQKGDILILRHDGFLSNVGIGGAMVHAALCVGDNKVIEALSDDEGGVVETHLIDCLQADKAVLLRPKELTEDELAKGILLAYKLLGFHYDIFFEFSSEEERKMIVEDFEKAKAGAVKLCCTELPHFCFLEHVTKLDLFRTRRVTTTNKILSLLGLTVGEEIITADMYLEANFQIVWASKGCSPEWFKSRGASEKTLNRVSAYWASLKD